MKRPLFSAVLLLCGMGLLHADIGDNAPAFPSTMLNLSASVHPVLPHPDANFLTALWQGPGKTGVCTAGNLPARYSYALSHWTGTNPGSGVVSSSQWVFRAVVLSYLASKQAGCANATWLSTIESTLQNIYLWGVNIGACSMQAQANCTISSFTPVLEDVAIAYDWVYADLDATSKADALAVLVAWGNGAANSYQTNYYGPDNNPYNDSFYGDLGPAILYIAPVVYADDATNGPIIARFTADLFVNKVLPIWKQEFGPQGGGWQEDWNGYVSHSAVDQISFIFPWANIWNHWMGTEGTANDFWTVNPWMKNWAYYWMRTVRPDFFLEKWGDVAKPYYNFEYDFFGNGAGLPPSNQGMSSLAGLGEAFGDTTIRGWARLSDDDTSPDGFEPSGWPYYKADCSSASGVNCAGANTTTTRSALTLVTNEGGLGRIAGRTGWTENDTDWQFEWGGTNRWSHEAADAGAFTIFNRGSLAIRSGTYQAGYNSWHHQLYAMQGIAHNIVTVTDPADSYSNETTALDNPDNIHIDNQPLPNDGGQRRVGSPYNGICYGATPNTGAASGCSSTGGSSALTADSFSQALTCTGHLNCGGKDWTDRQYELFHTSDLLTYVASPSETSPKYIYAAVDLAPAYNNQYSVIPQATSTTYHRAGTINRSNRVQHYIRHFLVIPRGTASYFVIFDDVQSTNSTFTKKWLLHTINKPTVSGSTFTVTRADNAYILPYCNLIAQWQTAGQISQYSVAGGVCKYQYAGKMYGFNVSPSATSITCVGGPGNEFNIGGTGTGCTGTVTGGVNYSHCSSTGQCGGADQAGYPVGSGGDGLGATSDVVPYTPDSGATYPVTPLEPGGWRIEETPTVGATQDAFLNVMLATNTTDTNTVSTVPTESTSCGSYTGSTSCYTVTWQDNAGGCTYTVTFPQRGTGGFVSIAGAGCSSTASEDIQSVTCTNCVGAGGGFAVAPNTWVQQATKGVGAMAYGYDRTYYAKALGESVYFGGYHYPASDDNQAFLGYDFSRNSWDALESGNQLMTATTPGWGHPMAFTGYDTSRNEIVTYGGVGSNQGQDGRLWEYDVLGQTGRPKPTSVAFGLTRTGFGVYIPKLDSYLMYDIQVGTYLWNHQTNVMAQKIGPTGTGALPSATGYWMTADYRAVDGKVYAFGGGDSGRVTCGNVVYRYDDATPAWTALSPTGTPPAGTCVPGWVYDADDDLFLTVGGQANGVNLTQVFAYHPDTNTWETITPTGTFDTNQATFARLSYDTQHKVFILVTSPASGATGCYSGDACSQPNAAKTYFFRYKTSTGPNGGWSAATYSASSGGLNVNTNLSWAKNPATAVNGTTLYFGWMESGNNLDATNAGDFHPYIKSWNGSSFSQLGSYSQMEPSASYYSVDTLGLAYAGATLWATWQPSASGQNPLYAASWNGTTWTAAAVGTSDSFCTGNAAACSYTQEQIVDVAGTPTMTYIERVTSSNLPQRAWVRQWTGTSWNQLGGTVDVNSANAGDYVSSVAVASDGVNPWVGIVEANNLMQTAFTLTAPQVYVTKWSGSAWVQQGSALNSANSWGQEVAVAYMGAAAYACWTQKGTTTPGTTVADQPPRRFCDTFIGTAGGGVGPGTTLNINNITGWASRPRLTVIGTSLYLSWTEQANLSEKPEAHVAVWNGSTWTRLGGSLNQDTVNGSSQGADIVAYNSEPAVVTAEVNWGATRDVYPRQYSGATQNWSGLGTVVSVSPSSIPTETVGEAVSITLTGSGFTSGPTWSLLSGTPPGGMSGSCITGITASTCLLSGTISSNVGSPYSFTIHATDGTNVSNTTFTVTVNATPAMTTSSPLPNATQGVSYSVTLTISGGTAPNTCAITTGSLLGSGLSLNTSSCQIAGTGGTPALYSFSITPSDSNGVSGSATPYLLTVQSSVAVGGSVSGGQTVSAGGAVRF